jgi:hypothetical protein
MKRRKTLLEKEEILYSSDNFRILNEGNQVIFEIWGFTTLDVAEAVSLLIMHGVSHSDPVWELPTSFFDKNVFSEKSLYWLSGGDSEWITLDNYSDSWFNCLFDFCSKWSKSIEEAVENSKTLLDIRNHFEENLSLLRIYDWAISKGFVR